MNKTNTPIVAAAAVLTLVSCLAGFAQTSAMHKPMKHAMGKSATVAKSVYICKDCQAYYSPVAAKKRGYKDAMGHTLTKTSKIPAGYKDGTKMMM